MAAGNNKSSLTSNEDDFANGSTVKVVNIADPTVAEAMMQADRLDKNASNKNRNNAAPHSTALVDGNALKQVLSFATANNKKSSHEEDQENNKDNKVNEADAKQGENRCVYIYPFLSRPTFIWVNVYPYLKGRRVTNFK